MAKSKNNDVANDLIDGLKEVIDHDKGKISLRTTVVEVPKPLKIMTSKDLKKVREKQLNMSQTIFAKFLNVSPETVRAWEQGKTSPKGPALVMLNLAKNDKQAFLEAVYKAS